MTTGPGQRFVRSEGVKLKRVGSGTAAYVSEQRALHVLNPTAVLLLEYLAEPAGLEELVIMLREATDGSREIIADDLPSVLDGLVQHRLLQRVG